MADYVRRLVSGNKARFRDGQLRLELDLVYITDDIIIMGYPATGVEGFYRNRREDVKKFLDHRHGTNYWIFNFCPIRENSYSAKEFGGRVTRYPFPDHHAPPLALLPLVAREIRVWLSESSKRVAVLHCKAGKGRSGTLACAYLLSLDVSPSSPRMEKNYTAKEWADKRAEEWMEIMPDDDASIELNDGKHGGLASIIDTSVSPKNLTQSKSKRGSLDVQQAPSPGSNKKLAPAQTGKEDGTKSLAESLQSILDLHSSRRMRKPTSSWKKRPQGVSIPSQRRWLHYWSLLLAHQGPNIWPLPSPPPSTQPKIKLSQIKIRMNEMSGVKVQLVKAANMLIDRTQFARTAVTRNAGQSQVWASLARYDDHLVELLEKWEQDTRDEGSNLGKGKASDEHNDRQLVNVFTSGKWDKEKMVCPFARMGIVDPSCVTKENTSDAEKVIVVSTLRLLSDANWVKIRDKLPNDDTGLTDPVPSEANSMYEVTDLSTNEDGVILDAHREVRIKLYMGQVFMGWLWIIPAFHMGSLHSLEPIQVTLLRKDVDFPLGIGSELIDVQVTMSWCTDTEGVQPAESIFTSSLPLSK